MQTIQAIKPGLKRTSTLTVKPNQHQRDNKSIQLQYEPLY